MALVQTHKVKRGRVNKHLHVATLKLTTAKADERDRRSSFSFERQVIRENNVKTVRRVAGSSS